MVCYKIYLLCLSLAFLINFVNPKSQYVQPLNMGMQMAIPYDIANIFIRPIAGVTSVVLTVSLALIILFGIITSPFGYFFGIPSRKYVTGGSSSSSGSSESRKLGETPEIIDAFWLFPDEFNSKSCHLLAVCYAHSVLHSIPPKLIKGYAFFSKNLINIDTEFEEAIINGIDTNNGDNCSKKYKNCDQSIISIIIKTFIQMLPNRSRRRTKSKLNY